MPTMPQAEPCPDRPPLHLTGGFLAIAVPTRTEEACFAAPAVRALKNARPQGTLVIVCPEQNAPIWEVMPEVDQVITYSEKTSVRQLARSLKNPALDFDSAILWEKNVAARAIHKAKIRQRLGLPSKELQKLITDPVPVVTKPGPVQHRVQHYLRFVEKLDVEAFAPKNFTVPPRPNAPARPRLAIAPDSDFGNSAIWPAENFAVLLHEFLQKDSHEIHLISQNKKDFPAALKEIAAKNPQKITLHPTQNPADALEFLASCELLIANDGSLPHLAAHTGTPTVTIFGPNEAAWKRPLGKIHAILREHVPCAPCFLPQCPLDHRCLSAITPEQVLAEMPIDH